MRPKKDQHKKYWMPYMDMSNKYRKMIGFTLFLLNSILSVFSENLDIIVSVLGSTTMPFITYVIPGALYYTYL